MLPKSQPEICRKQDLVKGLSTIIGHWFHLPVLGANRTLTGFA